MDLDTLLHHYLGDGDPGDPVLIDAASQRIALDFGVERDPGRRFALWALLLMLGQAPDPDIAFKREADRKAARDFARMMARAETATDAG